MFVDIRRARREFNPKTMSITEFYPMAKGAVIIPISSEKGKTFHAFNICKGDIFSVGPLDEAVMEYDDYKEELNRFLDKVGAKDESCLLFPVSDLYDRYVTASKMIAVAGVVSAVPNNTDSNIITTSEYPIFVPPEGVDVKLDLESYWKSLVFMLPNLIADGSTVSKMYNIYLKEISMKNDKRVKRSPLLIKSKNLKELMKSVEKALGRVDIESDEIRDLLLDGELIDDTDMLPYFDYMLSKHKVTSNIAAGYIYYLYESAHRKRFELADMEDLYETTDRLIVATPSRKIDKPKRKGLI